MLLTMASSLAFTKRKAMMIFPESVTNFWNNWELQAMVLLSLSFQSLLIFLGTKRKYSSRISHRIILWFAYLSADGLATISLSVLSDKVGQSRYHFVEPKIVITSLWAPFLLLHLGGPDTITAYSMEDNELWLRHLLKFGVQVGVAFYIFLRTWTNVNLNILAILVFIAGIIKIGEKTWVLMSASSEQFKQFLFPNPDPGPNYARFMEAHSLASYDGFKVDVQDLIESPSVGDQTYVAAEDIVLTGAENDISGADTILIAHKFFETFKRLFADLILSFQDVLESRLSIENGSSNQVFELIEAELAFIYDVFYTKAILIHSTVGGFLRLISFSSIITVLWLFCVTEKNEYPKADILITYVLLVGAVILEIYSVILLVSSDWTMLWLIKHKNKVTDVMIQVISAIPFAARNRKWSNSMAQFNLISFCLKAKKQRFGDGIRKKVAKCCLIRIIKHATQSYKKFMHGNIKTIPDYLKKLIFEQFLKKIKDAKENLKDEQEVAEEIKKFTDHRGEKVLEGSKYSRKLMRSVEVEFDQSILLWHIATDLCYNSVPDEDVGPGTGPNFREASKLLSEYMLHLLVMKPFMLPDGIGEIRFQDTCAEVTEFIKERKSIQDERGASRKLLKVCSDGIDPSKVKGDRSKSVLFDACKLAKSLLELEIEEGRETPKMWELITYVWLEMLAYAASHCQGIHHAQQLKRGGELLTHVWLLMAHLGITKKFQISKGHRRTKLILK